MMRRNMLLLHSLLVLILAATFVLAGVQINLLTKAAPGDWAEYSVTRQNETVPLLGFKDQKHWRTISAVEATSVRIDEYFMMGNQRTSGLGRLVSVSKPFEPISGLAEIATVSVVSESTGTLTVAGKNFACTKVERKISQPLEEDKFQARWEGTSTIWVCPDVALGGLVKMENRYIEQLTASSEANKIVETWVLSDFGFKNWKE